MYEVELKVRADRDAVEATLEAEGAKPLGSVTQLDTYYDAPMRDFAATDEALRIRREHADGETTKLTYKGPLIDETSKTREEHETTVEDADALIATLGALGFDAVATVEKHRERFEFDGYTVTLDRVEDLGEFVEVETEAHEEGIDDAREGVRATLEDLDLDPEGGIRTSYLELLLDNAQ